MYRDSTDSMFFAPHYSFYDNKTIQICDRESFKFMRSLINFCYKCTMRFWQISREITGIQKTQIDHKL